MILKKKLELITKGNGQQECNQFLGYSLMVSEPDKIYPRLYGKIKPPRGMAQS